MNSQEIENRRQELQAREKQITTSALTVENKRKAREALRTDWVLLQDAEKTA